MQRPTAVLMRDHYALHRNSYSGDVDETVVWTDWDYALAEAVQLLEDYTTPEGHVVWEADSERVTFDAKKKISKARAAIERKTRGSKNKAYEPDLGEYWVTTPRLMHGEEWPTLEEWVLEQNEKNKPVVE